MIRAVPQGALVTLTYEGNENGYVTVDYQGATGWMYGDLLGDIRRPPRQRNNKRPGGSERCRRGSC